LRHFVFAADAATVARQPVARPDNRGAFSYTAALSADGRLLAYGNMDVAYIVIHDVDTGRDVRQISCPEDRGVVTIAFSPDRRMLAWSGFQRTIHVLEAVSGRERTRFDGHKGQITSLAFSGDGRKLISGSEDTTAVVWDLTGKTAKREPLTEADLVDRWTDLISTDAARAYRAMQELMSSPGESVKLLSKHLEPVPAPDTKRQAALIAELGSETFATREAAMKELTKIVAAAEPALRNALEASPSPEARRRIEQLLAKLEDYGTAGEPLRQARAIECLERIATPEARQLLQKLAEGVTGVWLTREAKAALQRLERLNRKSPEK
jgi:hypothetical protein